ncbi:replication protein A 70 kDa DNA-binding subunit C-like isoform X1 [Rosa rugosa]|uniref:replication protein A 70 kDa DNA-binding subunit C-like isoform X1 n=1 Tax=Rosa rugosa TaxID=74645 RepID=UPI002B40A20A|nr:replication protein A 70 kDa DNA-binding subunit C-like isoform X1 [Rosa rugosa]XP_062000418.1 replication protein A 70 kDa DNA-binding subunit C-like isoform X1 [Rosa rugosa]
MQNIRKEDVQVTLWGDVARTIDINAIRTTPAPVLAVFTSLKVNKYHDKIALSNTGNTFFFLNPDMKEAEDYKQYFGEPHHAAHILSTRPKQPRTPAELQAVKQMSVSDLNICDPNNYKNKTVYCTAKIGKFVPEERWFYLACPKCFKEMRKKPQSQLLICAEHDMQQPLYRFIVTALINDETDEASTIIKGKQAEELFGTTCEDLILNKNLDNPNILPPEILRIEGQIKLLQLEIGTTQNVIVKGIHEDIRGLNPTQRIQPSSSTADNIQPSS